MDVPPHLGATPDSAPRPRLRTGTYWRAVFKHHPRLVDPSMESLTSKVQQALSLQGDSTTDGAGNHRDEARVLPPNITEADFDKALEEFKEIVGRTHVETVDINTLMDGDYMHQPKTHDGFYVLDQNDLVASAVVRPGNTEEVQALVRIANKYKIPLWITSIGRNLGYGGAARIHSNLP